MTKRGKIIPTVLSAGITCLRLANARQVTYVLVECILLHQLFDADMHSVVPEVSWVSRYVDALAVGVGQTYLTIYSQPVLQRQDHTLPGCTCAA